MKQNGKVLNRCKILLKEGREGAKALHVIKSCYQTEFQLPFQFYSLPLPFIHPMLQLNWSICSYIEDKELKLKKKKNDLYIALVSCNLLNSLITSSIFL